MTTSPYSFQISSRARRPACARRRSGSGRCAARLRAGNSHERRSNAASAFFSCPPWKRQRRTNRISWLGGIGLRTRLSVYCKRWPATCGRPQVQGEAALYAIRARGCVTQFTHGKVFHRPYHARPNFYPSTLTRRSAPRVAVRWPVGSETRGRECVQNAQQQIAHTSRICECRPSGWRQPVRAAICRCCSLWAYGFIDFSSKAPRGAAGHSLRAASLPRLGPQLIVRQRPRLGVQRMT
jgi:hypothetical protein